MFGWRLSLLVLLAVFTLIGGQEEEPSDEIPTIPETTEDAERFENPANWCFDEDYENNRYVWFKKGAFMCRTDYPNPVNT